MTTELYAEVRPDIAEQRKRGFFELPSTGCPGCSDGRRWLMMKGGGTDVIEEHDVFCAALPDFGAYD